MSDLPPPSAAPDTKDWTWTIINRCEECGFDPQGVTTEALPELIQITGGRFAEVVQRPDSAERPAPTVWSPIEYGRHTADVCEVMTARLRLILDSRDAAEFPNWDGEAAAVADEYWRSSPTDTARLLSERSEAAAAAWAGVEGRQWDWTGVRGDGVEFTAWTLGLYLAHELVHHLHDAEG